MALEVPPPQLQNPAADQPAELRERFISAASHELRTPLTSLKLQLQMIIRAVQNGGLGRLNEDRVHRMLTNSNQQVDVLIDLIGDLLQVVQIPGGELSLQRTEIDLCQLLQDVLGRLGTPELPLGPPPQLEVPGLLMGCWDRLKLEQALTNLLLAASKQGPGDPLRIRMELLGESWVRIQVHKPMNESPEPLSLQGSGFEFYLVQSLVMAHEGRLKAELVPGSGVDFVLELPRGLPG